MFVRFLRGLFVLIVVLGIVFGTGVAGAGTITFGPASGDWNSGENWDLNRVPGAGDDVVISVAPPN